MSQISTESEESELTITINSEKKIEVEEVIMPDATTWRIMKLNLPEWHLILIGCICSLALGGTFPAFAILFGEIYWVSKSHFRSSTYHIYEVDFIYKCIMFRCCHWMMLMKLEEELLYTASTSWSLELLQVLGCFYKYICLTSPEQD